jgi:flavorubredoxin
LSQILPNAQVHILFPNHYDMDLSPREEWDEKAPEMARLFAEFMAHNKQAIAAT